VEVEGSGSPSTPYVISAPGSSGTVTVADGACVSLGGDGSPGAPLTPTLNLDPAPGNLAQCGPDGLLVQASTALQAVDTPTVDTTVTGTGTPGDPFEVSAAVILDPAPPGGGTNLMHAGPDGLYAECADVRGCLAAGAGIVYDATTGTIAAEGTVVEAGTGVTVTGTGTTADPYEVSTVPPETGCGLTGDGSTAAPLAASVADWPYPCDVDTNAGGVYCDSSGQLRSEPRGQIAFQQDQQVLDVANLAVPAAPDTEIATHTITVTNPDACRAAFLMMEGEVDADFNLPAGAGAALGIATDEMSYLRNSGTTAILDTHIQGTKVVNGGTIPPGGSLTFTLSIRMGRGSGGATYNRVQSWLRAFVFVL
jgi:hypothetical protein